MWVGVSHERNDGSHERNDGTIGVYYEAQGRNEW